LTEIQKITLRDVFRQEGLSERRIEDVMLLLRFKPERVQLAFYYTSIGWTQEAAADEIGVSRVQVSKYLSGQCTDIKEYLHEYVTI
jgi:hypothetical protein